MAAVDQDDELNGTRPAEVDERVERGAHGPSRVQDVVNQQDLAIVDGERDFGAADERLRPHRVAHQVIAVERDVERAGGHVFPGDLDQTLRQPSREVHAARADPDERQGVNTFVPFEDLVSDACEGSSNAVRIHDYRHAGLCVAGRRNADKVFR